MRHKLHEYENEKEKEREKGKHERKMSQESKEREEERLTKWQAVYWWSNVFSKWKSTTVKLLKESKRTYFIPSWIPILIISFTIIEDMMPSFDGISTMWTLEIFLREESQPILTNVVILELNSISEVQYKEVMTIDNE